MYCILRLYLLFCKYINVNASIYINYYLNLNLLNYTLYIYNTLHYFRHLSINKIINFFYNFLFKFVTTNYNQTYVHVHI